MAFSKVVETIRRRFEIANVIFVGDRGMITSARINEDLRDTEGLDWISALRSESAKKKDAMRVNADGFPVQSFQDLLKDLATLCRSRMRLTNNESEFRQLTESTRLQRRVFELVSPRS